MCASVQALNCNYVTCKRCTAAPQIGPGRPPLRGPETQSPLCFLKPFYLS